MLQELNDRPKHGRSKQSLAYYLQISYILKSHSFWFGNIWRINFGAPSTSIVSRCCLQKPVSRPGVFDEHQGSFQDWPSHCFLTWKSDSVPNDTDAFFSFLLPHGGSWSWTAFWQLFSGDGIFAICISDPSSVFPALNSIMLMDVSNCSPSKLKQLKPAWISAEQSVAER